MAFRVTDLMFVVDPTTPVIPMHLTCGPFSVVETTQCPAVSANQPRTGRQFNCGLTLDTKCPIASCAYDSARLSGVSDSDRNLQQLRMQLAEMREGGMVLLN
jgi:hypothetical protein